MRASVCQRNLMWMRIGKRCVKGTRTNAGIPYKFKANVNVNADEYLRACGVDQVASNVSELFYIY